MAESPCVVPAVRFTTRDIPVSVRRRALSELREQGLLPLEPIARHPPRVDLVKWHLPGARILSGSFAGVRQGGESHRTTVDDDIFFGINLSGDSLVDWRGHEISLRAGQAIAVDADAGPFTVLRPGPARMIGVRLPRGSIPVESAGARTAPLRLLPADTAVLRLLTSYVRGALSGPVLSTALAEIVVLHLTDLIGHSLEPHQLSPPANRPSVRAARLMAIKSDIDRRLTDPALSPITVAARHGISTRYLHKLFEDETTTYSRYVLDRRLAIAHRTLRDPRNAGQTISSIAHDVGFGDLAYFNRAFRRRFHITPSELRRRGVGEAGSSP
ncbi:helix-turn-helix domain-containing protein [Kribbella turkmenica]|nr:helix-turn-helix domain-containing protein [Kribbella turkmenica]